MSSYSTYSLMRERWTAELQQSFIRILLSIVTALVLFLYYHTSEPERIAGDLYATPLIFISTALLLYSICVWVFERWMPEYITTVMVASGILDIVLITTLMRLAIPTEIPFYIWYIFYVVNVASKFGWQYAILALSASIVSFTWVLGLYSSVAFSPFALGSIGYLLVLAFMFGQISERQLAYQSYMAVVNEFKAELAGIADTREIISHVLARTKGLLRVEHTFFLPASRGADASLAPGLRSQGSDPTVMAIFRENGGAFNVENVLHEQRPLISNSIKSELTPPDTEQPRLGLKNVVAAPMMLRTTPIGVVYAVNRKDKRFSRSDMLLLEVIASQIAPVVENTLLWERLREAAAAEERLRIARDLHDSVLQTLAAINLHLERCKILIEKDTDKALQGLSTIKDIATHALAEVRAYLSELRMAGPEPQKFEHSVRKLCEYIANEHNMSIGVEVNIDVETLPVLPTATAFQVLRELVNNAAVHSDGTAVSVSIVQENEWLNIRVSDNGKGFAVEQTRAHKAAMGHLGLIGIEERIRAAKGVFELRSKEGEGTTARVGLPLKAKTKT